MEHGREEDDSFDAIEEFDNRFQEIFGTANGTIQSAVTELMDANHETIQHSRRVIQELRSFANRYDEIVENLIMAHAIAAKEISDLYGDMLLKENGVEEVTDEGDMGTATEEDE